jgi:ATP-binding cassette subfamily C protein CydD
MASVKKSTNKQTRRWVFQRARSARTWIVLAIGLGFLSGILLIAQARLLAQIVHGAFMQRLSFELLSPAFGALLAVIVLRAFLGWGREVAGFQAGARIRTEVRMALMQHIMALGPAYTQRQKTGALASTLMDQVESLHGFYAFYLPQLALAVMIPVSILAFVFPISWAAGTLLLATAPLIPLFMVLIGMGAESISQRNFQALARLSAQFLDVLKGLPTLKLFDRSRGEVQTIAAVSADYRMQTMSVLRVAFLSSAVLEFFCSMAIALVAVYLGMHFLGYLNFGAYGQSLTLAAGFFILLLAPDFFMPLRELGIHYHARAEALGAADQIIKILSEPRPANLMGTQRLERPRPIQLAFQNVALAFDNGKRPALRGITFDVAPGEHVALVGPSGAGKTTVLNLILGFLQPDAGHIRINDRAMTDIDLESWRSQLAWVGQDPLLFHGSVLENIRLGRWDASDAEIHQAARTAGVLDFTAHLPAGLDTRVGEHGFGLSRGQAQRIALARAFVKDAPILILDEPTTGLDQENEHLVLEALEKLSRGRTVLTVMHRLTAIEHTDQILVFVDGSIVENGSYENLMAAGGVFKHLAFPESE